MIKPPRNYDDSPEPVEEDKGMAAVAVLPKSALGDGKFEVGDSVTLKITALRGDEVEVEYQSGDKEEEEEAPETPDETETEAPAEVEAPETPAEPAGPMAYGPE